MANYKCEYSISDSIFSHAFVTLSVPVHCGDPAAAAATERTNAWAETFFLDLALRFVRSRALLERKISGLSDLRHVTSWVDRC